MPNAPAILFKDILLSVINNLYPSSVTAHQALWVGNQPPIALPNVQWITKTPLQLVEQKFDRQYPLAVVMLDPADTHLNAEAHALAPSIQKCRDLYAQHALVLLTKDSDLNMTAMGFSRLTPDLVTLQDYQDRAMQLWQFNLFDYKQLPDWLNSRFWANPEMWDKARW